MAAMHLATRIMFRICDKRDKTAEYISIHAFRD